MCSMSDPRLEGRRLQARRPSFLLAYRTGQSGAAPEQKHHNHDQQQQAEAASIIVIWGSKIEAPATE